MILDKVIGVPREKVGERIGALSVEDMTRLEPAMLAALGFRGEINF